MIVQRERFFQSGAKAFTGMWILYGVAKRWNSRPVMWNEVRRSLKEFINGYVYDMDNGSVGMWGGSGNRRIKYLFVSKELSQVAQRIARGG